MLDELIVLWMLSLSMAPAMAQQVSIGIGSPNVSIGINLPLYPDLVPVPGYPVYYAPRLSLNYFFYDGMYWVYQGDDWYASSWYNGPWGMVGPEFVPVFVLRIPVRYYRQPPAYFRGWQPDGPPRWDQHWGNEWAQRHRGWNQWNRKGIPARPPLPEYQREYSGDRYPRAEQQREIHSQNYRYQPRDPVVRQHYQAPTKQNMRDRGRHEREGLPADRAHLPQGMSRHGNQPNQARQSEQREQRDAVRRQPSAPKEPNQGQGRDHRNDRMTNEDRGQERRP